MKALITTAVAALALSSIAASANTISRNGVWETYVTHTKDSPACGMMTIDSKVTREVHVKWFSGSDHLTIQLLKIGWQIPRGTEIAVELDFDREKFGSVVAVGGSAADFGGPVSVPRGSIVGVVTLDLKGAAASKGFLAKFGEADTMSIRFPDGTEQPWVTRMIGSRKAIDAFMWCITGLHKLDAQPPRGKQPDTQPFGDAPKPPTTSDRGA